MDAKPTDAADRDDPPEEAERLEACLPAALRGPATTITRIAMGFSGAGVYRVEAAGQAFVLKISGEGEPSADWRRKLHIRQLAANAGLAPRVIHVDEVRGAVVSPFVVDRSFSAFYANPQTHEAALEKLGRTLRRVHDLPFPAGADAQDPRDALVVAWSGLGTRIVLPDFVGQAIQRVLSETAPPPGRAAVLSHNDVNPSNFVYDGENILLLDWEVAGANDPFYDLAGISVFLRMDDETCRRLLAAHDGQPVPALPARLAYNRRLVAALCGATFLNFAHRSGHAGAAGGETVESAPSFADVVQRMRAGSVNLATSEGQWCFGLALVKASVGL